MADTPDLRRRSFVWAWYHVREHFRWVAFSGVIVDAIMATWGALFQRTALVNGQLVVTGQALRSRVIGGVLGVLVGFGIVFVALLFYAACVAPYRQRDEVRRVLESQQKSEQESPSVAAGILVAVDRSIRHNPGSLDSVTLTTYAAAVKTWVEATHSDLVGLDERVAALFGEMPDTSDWDGPAWMRCVIERLEALKRLQLTYRHRLGVQPTTITIGH